MNSTLLSKGFVFHGRSETARHSFRYPVFTLLFPVDSEPQMQAIFKRRFWGTLSVRACDYLNGSHGSLNEAIRHFLAEHCDYHPDEVYLQTFPRMFGYVFNPVSFWFCKKQGKLDAVLCEVNNTFGERHFYWLNPEGGITSDLWLRSDKVFHVSPFFPIDGYYKFRFNLGEFNSRVDIFYYDQQDHLRLSTWIEGTHSPLSENSIFSIIFKYGWMTPLVVLRIHWQAFQLWIKRVRFFTKPEPPRKEIT
ncbi:DUF1365 domain-containing protein [Bdellovibrio sp. HCB2-146]|uniref:DUF1365 domain-containing protein n=1 Tax=Bdellovibrio sp. HCB2-146 TaxID=3394362 RepID=UPI0039BC4B4D